jgi:hypothetical protein
MTNKPITRRILRIFGKRNGKGPQSPKVGLHTLATGIESNNSIRAESASENRSKFKFWKNRKASSLREQLQDEEKGKVESEPEKVSKGKAKMGTEVDVDTSK